MIGKIVEIGVPRTNMKCIRSNAPLGAVLPQSRFLFENASGDVINGQQYKDMLKYSVVFCD